MIGTKVSFGASLLFATLASAQGGDVPPRDGKLLSEIIKSVEAEKRGTITQVEFDHGFWQVEVQQGNQETMLQLDPKTGNVNGQQGSPEYDETLPPPDGKPLSEVIKSVEDQKAGLITEVEFDDGFWEVTVRKDGKKVKMDIDPRSGTSRAR